MSEFRLRSRDFIRSPAGKRRFNQQLFGAIAAEYSRTSALLSFGRDRAWKQRLIADLPPTNRPRCLDLACGNGDLSYLLLRRYPDAEIVALDLTAGMLALAQIRLPPDRVGLVQADMTCTGLPDGAFDIVTVGYGLRNAPDLGRAIAEIVRVLRPGGLVAILEFSRFDAPLASRVEIGLLRFWGGVWGLVRSGNPDTYGYIADSLAAYPRRSDLTRKLTDSGLSIHTRQRHFFGVVETLVAGKSH